MSWQASQYAREISLKDAKLSGIAGHVLYVLAQSADPDREHTGRGGEWIEPIVKKTGTTVREALRELVEAGHLEVGTWRGGDSGHWVENVRPGMTKHYRFPPQAIGRIEVESAKDISTTRRWGAGLNDIPNTRAAPQRRGSAPQRRGSAPQRRVSECVSEDVRVTQPWCETSCECDGTGWEQEDPENPNSRARPCHHRSTAMWGTA